MAVTISAFPSDSQDLADQDIYVSDSGDIALVSGLEDVRQRVIERLRFWVGQWFLGINAGVGYRTQIFQNPVSVGLAAAVVSDAIRSIDEVTGVTEVHAEIEPITRRMSYYARVQTRDGDIVLSETIA